MRQFEGHEHSRPTRRASAASKRSCTTRAQSCTREGFIDKNRDALMPEADELLRSSSDAFLRRALRRRRRRARARARRAGRRGRGGRVGRGRAFLLVPSYAASPCRVFRARRRRLVRRRRRRRRRREAGAGAASASTLVTETLSQQFKGQLERLMGLDLGDQVFRDCLKPNDANKPDLLEPKRLVEQPRCGVLEAADA